MTQKLEIGDVVMCTVERIVGTTVFVKIEGNGEGSIILSEIAPGRIRNLRDYVVPKKIIICKVIRVSGDRIDLSLRRVSPKEQKEIREKYKLEKSCQSILKTILGKNAESVISEIEKNSSIYNFLEEAKENPGILEKCAGKEESRRILSILKDQKKKKFILKKEFTLTTKRSNGLELIKDILGKIKNLEIKYISAGRYSIKNEDMDPKKADNLITQTLEEIEKSAKKQGLDFGVK